MASVLGRITTADGSPRGPDVKHKVHVASRWLERGETVEVELPRNLVCAHCDGGGCDVCGGSGAVSIRERGAPAEVVQLTLPATGRIVPPPTIIALRIPEHGGPPPEPGLARGQLILTVLSAEAADPTVRKVLPSLLPPPSLVEPLPEPEAPAPPPEPRRVVWPLAVGVAFLSWLLTLLLLRALGGL